MHRTLGRSCQQAFGITAPILEKMLYATSNNLRGIRDRALLLFAYDSMCRRSELVSLRIEDIEFRLIHDQIKIKIRIRKSKTGQELYGSWIYPNQRTIEQINTWIKKARLINGFLFRGVNTSSEITAELKGAQINRIYKRLAKAANLPKECIKNISGHSIRVGATQDLLKSGASIPTILHKGRWSKTDTMMRYAENTNLD